MGNSSACPKCGRPYTVKPEIAGQYVKCLACGQTFRAPGEPAARDLPFGLAPAGSFFEDDARAMRWLPLAVGALVVIVLLAGFALAVYLLMPDSAGGIAAGTAKEPGEPAIADGPQVPAEANPLTKGQPPEPPTLAEQLAANSPAAIEALKATGDAAERTLVPFLENPDERVRRGACEALGVLGSEKSLENLAALTRRDKQAVAAAADKAVEAILKRRSERGASGDALAEMIFRLKLNVKGKAKGVAQRLAREEPNPQRRDEVAQALASLLADEDSSTRIAVIGALGVWHTPGVVPEMAKACKDSDITVRRAALGALAQVGTEAAAKAIAGRIKEDQFPAINALKSIGPAAEGAALDLLGDSDARTRTAALGILEEIGTQKSVPKLTGLSKSGDFSTRIYAERALKAIQSRKPLKR